MLNLGPTFGFEAIREALLNFATATRDECLIAYTAGGTYADFAEDRGGKLEAGFDADLVLD